MSAPLPGDITRQLRDMIVETNNRCSELETNKLLDIANAVERLEGNFLDLCSITAASADDLAEMKTIATFRLDRHHHILGKVAAMLRGTPVWNYAHKAEFVSERVMRTTELLAKRLKKVPR